MSSLTTFVSVSGLLDAALKSAAVLLLAAIAAGFLGRASAAARHLVWCLSISSLLLLPFASRMLPDWRVAWLPRWAAQPTQFAAIALTDFVQADQTKPLVDQAVVLPASAVRSPAEPHQESFNLPPAGSQSISPPRSSIPWLAFIWVAGGVWSLVPLAIGLGQLAGLHRRSQVVGDRRWLTLLDKLCRQLGVRRRVQLRRCESAPAPLTWGAVRPVLLVPLEADHWTEERRRLVLLHELAHVRRWDWLTQLIAHVACALYWFNPLVWLAARQMRIERERACDDVVLTSGARASDYARELLALATGLSDSRVSTLIAVPMARRGTLDDRLRGILDSNRSRKAIGMSAMCLGAALAAAMMAPLAMLRAAPAESKKSQAVQPTKETPDAPLETPETLEMTVNTSRVLTTDKTLLRSLVDDPEVAEITAVSATKIRVTAKKSGTTQVKLFDEQDNVYTVDTIVYPDARELKLPLRTHLSAIQSPVGRQMEQGADRHVPLAPDNSGVKEVLDVTLGEALRSALTNSKVLRNMGGRILTPIGPQSTANDSTRPSAESPEAAAAHPNAKARFVLARTNGDIARADFESGVRNIISDLERAYWDLYWNYRQLNAVQAGRDSALQTWRKVHALYETGSKGGEAEREAQAREQYFLFRAQVENTLGLLYTSESRLRYLMGLPPAHDRLIRPSDEPITAEVRFDWHEVISEGLKQRVDVSHDDELELCHVLTNSLRDLDRNYQISRTTFNRRRAAAKQVEAVTATYEMGTASLDMLLDAQRRLADAEIAYFRALVDYNVAILQVHDRKGSLLEQKGILLAEGARAGFDGRKK